MARLVRGFGEEGMLGEGNGVQISGSQFNSSNHGVTHFMNTGEHVSTLLTKLLSLLALLIGTLSLLGEKEVLHVLTTGLWIFHLLADALRNPASSTVWQNAF